jgi:pimeloyl-ACP methyl ester carboxylesterase
VRVEERAVDLDGMTLRYLAAGEGAPLLLLHGAGDRSFAWSWVLPELAGGYRVYAPTLPGIGDGARLTDRSSTAYAALVTGFMDALGIERAALIGNSLGGLIGLRLSLSDPARVSALGLVDSTGLGRVINPTFTSVNVPGFGAASIPWWRTPAGACQRAWGRAAMLFARPANAPQEWLAEQQKLALSPGHLEAYLAALRAHIHPGGQREVLVDHLSHLQVPTLVLWGAQDRVLPAYQARQAVMRLPKGRLEIIPECGHLPHVECPGDFMGAVGRFLKENHVPDELDRKERR